MSTAQVQQDSSAGFAKFSMFAGKTGKIERAIAFGFAMSSAYATVKKVRNNIRSKFVYTITVVNSDSIYPDVHGWIIDNMPRDKQHAVIVQSTDTSPDGIGRIMETSDGHEPPVGLRFLFDGEQEQNVEIGGHTIKVSVKSENDTTMQRRRDSVKFTCHGLDAREAVSNLLSTLSQNRKGGQRVPRLYMATRWNDWSRRDDLTMRSLDSVVLRAGVKEMLIADLEKFRADEEQFVRMGVPYHRGYLFYGPPGSGKTSIAKALATQFNMDVYYMPLSDLETDASLISLVSRVPAGAMLLLEDIDIAHAAKERNDDGTKNSATLSGMLNAIDGVATPHGLVVVMTTNNRAVLDEALIRPGRVDLEMNIDYVDHGQVAGIVREFVGVDFPFWGHFHNVSSADVVGAIVKNIGDVEGTLAAVRALA